VQQFPTGYDAKEIARITVSKMFLTTQHLNSYKTRYVRQMRELCKQHDLDTTYNVYLS